MDPGLRRLERRYRSGHAGCGARRRSGKDVGHADEMKPCEPRWRTEAGANAPGSLPRRTLHATIMYTSTQRNYAPGQPGESPPARENCRNQELETSQGIWLRVVGRQGWCSKSDINIGLWRPALISASILQLAHDLSAGQETMSAWQNVDAEPGPYQMARFESCFQALRPGFLGTAQR